jgi:hypothetical protein
MSERQLIDSEAKSRFRRDSNNYSEKRQLVLFRNHFGVSVILSGGATGGLRGGYTTPAFENFD